MEPEGHRGNLLVKPGPENLTFERQACYNVAHPNVDLTVRTADVVGLYAAGEDHRAMREREAFDPAFGASA